jgi:hypothetical protein
MMQLKWLVTTHKLTCSFGARSLFTLVVLMFCSCASIESLCQSQEVRVIFNKMINIDFDGENLARLADVSKI